jgi:ABC-type dipeptide/oligopeptide/nickel transport system permease component
MLLKQALRRIFMALPTLWLVLTIVFLALYLLPGDPVEALVDVNSEYVGQEYIEQLREELGLNKPLHIRYFEYLKGLIRGDLGYSWKTKRPVTTEIGSRIVSTLYLAIGGVFVSLAAGIPLGIAAALRRNRPPDYILTVLSVIGMAAPNFWLAMLLIYFLSFKLGWFPIIGEGDTSDPVSVVKHLVLPSLAIGAYSTGLITRMTRSSMLDVLSSDYVRTARAKGLRERRVLYLHALRNALLPVVSMAGISFIYLLSGSVVIEAVFARDGLGTLTLRAIKDRDAPLLQGTVLFFVGSIVIASAFLDLVYLLLDPRISHE